MNVIEGIKSRMDAKRKDSLEAYRRIVVAIAAGGPKQDATSAAQVLEAAGKSPDDLTADVAQLEQRKALAADAAKLAGIPARREVVKKELETAADVLAKAQGKFEEVATPLEVELRRLNATEQAGLLALDELRRTHPRAAEYAAMADTVKTLEARIPVIQRDMEFLPTQLPQMEKNAREMDTHKPDLAGIQRRISSLPGQLRQTESDLKSAKRDLAELASIVSQV